MNGGILKPNQKKNGKRLLKWIDLLGIKAGWMANYSYIPTGYH